MALRLYRTTKRKKFIAKFNSYSSFINWMSRHTHIRDDKEYAVLVSNKNYKSSFYDDFRRWHEATYTTL